VRHYTNETLRRVIGEPYAGVLVTDRGSVFDARSLEGVKQQIWKPAVVADRDGNLHLVFQDGLFGPEPPQLHYTTRSADGDWSPPTLLFGDTVVARDPELITTSTGELDAQAMAASSASVVRAAAVRRIALSLLHACSIGEKSGE